MNSNLVVPVSLMCITWIIDDDDNNVKIKQINRFFLKSNARVRMEFM